MNPSVILSYSMLAYRFAFRLHTNTHLHMYFGCLSVHLVSGRSTVYTTQFCFTRFSVLRNSSQHEAQLRHCTVCIICVFRVGEVVKLLLCVCVCMWRGVNIYRIFSTARWILSPFLETTVHMATLSTSARCWGFSSFSRAYVSELQEIVVWVKRTCSRRFLCERDVFSWLPPSILYCISTRCRNWVCVPCLVCMYVPGRGDVVGTRSSRWLG